MRAPSGRVSTYFLLFASFLALFRPRLCEDVNDDDDDDDDDDDEDATGSE